MAGPPSPELSGEMAVKIQHLWQFDRAIQNTWCRRSEFRAQDTTEYFLQPEKLQEISSPHYVPSIDDILRIRKPTDKCLDFNFRINRVKFNIKDAGGQAEQRQNLPDYLSPWLSQSQPNDRNFILFVASLSDYNQRHHDFGDKTMLDESVDLLRVLLSMQELSKCGFILFLNKRDIFEQKLKEFHDFPTFYHRYMEEVGIPVGGQPKLEEAEKVIAARFADAVRETPTAKDQLYCKFTCAVDTGMMEAIFNVVRKDIINDIIINPERHVVTFP